MAYCPECSGEIGAYDAKCSHCGYDFPIMEHSEEPEGLAYSNLGDLALIIGQIAAALGCVLSVIIGFFMLFMGNFFAGFIICPLSFFLQLAQFVVFVRVQNMPKPS